MGKVDFGRRIGGSAIEADRRTCAGRYRDRIGSGQITLIVDLADKAILFSALIPLKSKFFDSGTT